MAVEMERPGNMSPEDYEIALRLCGQDTEFKSLWDEHQSLKERLKTLSGKGRLTPEEEVEEKRLKRQKLWGKDKIAMKIREQKVSSSG